MLCSTIQTIPSLSTDFHPLGMRFRVAGCNVEEVSSRISHPRGKVQRDPELKKAHKQAVER